MRLLRKVVWALHSRRARQAIGICCFLGAASLSAGADGADSTVHSITMPYFEPQLPVAPGRDEFLVVCASCHSPRYVMMQPFLPQRQWEETVDKMAKAYGAQMDQEQRAAIIQYLVATHGPDSARAVAQDDDFGPAVKPAVSGEKEPTLALASQSEELAKQVAHGAKVFATHCAGCHGTTGRGDGLVAEVLLRKPKNLAAIRYSVPLLSQVMWNGKRGTAMPSWRNLPLADLGALAAYVQSLHPPSKPDQVSPESLRHGNQAFQQNCAPCHGAAGDGKGAAAAALIPEPANFQLKQPDFDYVLQVLSHGIPGTGMPAWNKQISESDREKLAYFVRSLFQTERSSK